MKLFRPRPRMDACPRCRKPFRPIRRGSMHFHFFTMDGVCHVQVSRALCPSCQFELPQWWKQRELRLHSEQRES